MTLVIRTEREPEAGPQFEYHRPGIALDGERPRVVFRKRVQLLRMLRRLRHPSFSGSMAMMLDRSDLEETARLLVHTDLMAAAGMREQLVRQEARFGEDHPWLLAAFDHLQRIHTQILWRRVLAQVELRFLLGLVLSSPGRANMVQLVQQRHGDDPVPRIVRCVRKLVEIQREFPDLTSHLRPQLRGSGHRGPRETLARRG